MKDELILAGTIDELLKKIKISEKHFHRANILFDRIENTKIIVNKKMRKSG